MAQAQGMHIDGTHWRLNAREAESRRRLWRELYFLDRAIALAIGRLYAVLDEQCVVQFPSNTQFSTAGTPIPVSLEDPLPKVHLQFSHKLGVIMGNIQRACFELKPPLYGEVLAFDRELDNWKNNLPAYFQIDNPDKSKDAGCPFLQWHRLQLHSAFHFTKSPSIVHICYDPPLQQDTSPATKHA